MLSINDILRKDAEDKSYHVLWLDDSSDSAYVIAALPLLFIFIFLNKYYVKGLLDSAIKM